MNRTIQCMYSKKLWSHSRFVALSNGKIQAELHTSLRTSLKFKSTLVMAWPRQSTGHYLSQCWPRSMSPNGITRPRYMILLLEYSASQNPLWTDNIRIRILYCNNITTAKQSGKALCIFYGIHRIYVKYIVISIVSIHCQSQLDGNYNKRINSVGHAKRQ